MKKILLFFSIIIVFINGYSQNIPKIDPELQKEMQLMDNEDLVKVNIVMKAQYDQFELRNKTNVLKTKEDKRDFVVSELKKYSKEEQRIVADYLDFFSKSSNVKEIKSHWLYNGIDCYATKNAIEEIASLEDVLTIGLEQMHYALFDNEKPKPAEAGSKEITYNVTKVRANDVWDELGVTGEGIIVSVLDSGVNYNHNDIKNQMWQSAEYPYHGYNFINNNNDPMDDHSHGTHCAGTVAGNGASGSQTGMAPDATIMAIKILNSGGGGTVSGTCSGIEFSVEHGAHILSMSIGWALGMLSDAERIMFRTTMANTLEAGVVASVAAGNEGDRLYTYPIPNNVRTPGNCPPPWLHPDQTIEGGLTCVVCVGATDSNDNIADFSSLGPVTWQNFAGFNDYAYNPGMGLIRPDVCAPGVDVKSLTHDSNTGYTYMSGTSMATPGVAGVMALMLSKNPELTPAEIDFILETTAVPLSENKSNTFGSGRINAYDAVNAVEIGPISVHGIVIDDSQGNNNGNANPGETIKLNVSLINESDSPVNNVSATIYSNSEYVNIINNNAVFGNIASNEIKTVDNAFSFLLLPSAPASKKITFNMEIETESDSYSNSFFITSYDYELGFSYLLIDDALENNNGILEPGETANIEVNIINSGNESVLELNGLLSSLSDEITINSNTASYGDLNASQSKAGIFNVTLSSSASPENINIPFQLLLTDVNGRTTNVNFVYQNKCNVIFDLSDDWGDGWNGNAIIVSFDDGTPSQSLTINNGSIAVHTLEISSGVNVSLTWQAGNYAYECFYDIYYENGSMIYSGSGNPGSGVFFSWINDCQGTNIECDPVQNLNINVVESLANITWEAPSSGTPVSYKIYQGSDLIETTTNTSYTSEIIMGLNEFCVYAVYDQCVSESVCEIINFPFDLVATSISDSEIKLEWDYVNIGSGTTFNIYRDDNVIASGIVSKEYNDIELVAATEYCYIVTAVSDGIESLPSDESCVTTYTGIEDYNGSLKVYPNPSNSIINIEGENVKEITVLNSVGQLVKIVSVQDNKTSFDVSQFKSGHYIIKVLYNDDKIENIKVVVNK
ncbi:MAG: S8 family serine peptidase [Bacteroidales bacterium]|jgi:subtilisin family serine protease|nr:S8 family serine peptidase [Bacteroidales bacterium]